MMFERPTTSGPWPARRLTRPLIGLAVSVGLLTPTSLAVASAPEPTPPGALPPKTVPTTTTPSGAPTTAPAPAFSVTGVPIDGANDQLPYSTASDVIPAANGRGVVMVGTIRRLPGMRSSAVTWESVDGVNWVEVNDPELDAGVSSSAQATAWVGTTLALGGSYFDAEDKAHAAVWLAPDGRDFQAVEDPLGRPGWISDLAASDTRLVAAAGTLRPTGATVPLAAVRSPEGVWAVVELDHDGIEAGVSNIEARGLDVVITGWVQRTDEIDPAIWTSHDGGATFAAADMSQLDDAGTNWVGAVRATDAGFVALVCATIGGRSTTTMALSPNGDAWTRQPLAVTSSLEAPRAEPGAAYCGDLAIIGGQPVWGSVDLTGVVTRFDSSFQGTSLRSPRQPGTVALSAPLIVDFGGRVLAISRLEGGFAAGYEAADEYDESASNGLPPGAARVSTLGVYDGGDVLALDITRYPIVEEFGLARFQWRSEEVWRVATDGSTFVETPGVAPPPRATGVVKNGTTSVAWGAVIPGGETNGPIGDAAIWTRPAGGTWSEASTIQGGPGGQRFWQVVVAGAAFVAIGDSREFDGQRQTTLPIVYASLDGVTWTPESPLFDGDTAEFWQVCPLPDDSLLFIGTAVRDNAVVEVMSRRDVTAAWESIDPAALAFRPTGIDVCGTTSTRAVLVDDDGFTYSTTDGRTYQVGGVVMEAGQTVSPSTVLTIDDRLVMLGTVEVEQGLSDAVMWTSADGLDWTRIEIDGMGGPGPQSVSHAVVRGDQIVVAGWTSGQAVSWSVPIAALGG